MARFALFFVLFASAWALQIYLTHRQSRRFMSAVGELRERGTTAVGVSDRSSWRSRTYVALAADASDCVVGALELRGFSVLAGPAEVPELVGRSLHQLVDRDGDRRHAAASMAAEHLIDANEAEQSAEDADARTSPVSSGRHGRPGRS